MSGRYVVEEDDGRFMILDTQVGLLLASVSKVDRLGGALPAETLAGRVRNLIETLHDEQEQLAQDHQTLNAYLLGLTPYELKTLAQGVRKGDRLFTPDQS